MTVSLKYYILDPTVFLFLEHFVSYKWCANTCMYIWVLVDSIFFFIFFHFLIRSISDHINTPSFSNAEFWEKQKYRRNDIFLSFHGSETLDMLIGKPTMREFVKDDLLPVIHKKWNEICSTRLEVFFDEYSVEHKIPDDIPAGIYRLQVSNASPLV